VNGSEQRGLPSHVGIWCSQIAHDFGWESLVMLAFTVYLLVYGLVPLLGGDRLGLVGADEPRYAQVAREMLHISIDTCRPIKQQGGVWFVRQAELRSCYVAHSVTPVLYGLPWLEKPALFYWRAMFSFDEFGVHDWSARLPSTSFAIVLIVLIFLHMKRFRPGGQLHAALITASCAAIIGFARGASTDMQMAAPFCIGMLGWYAWYETDSKFWLFDLYFFVGFATLAKGPVAPAMALIIIFLFAALRREWSLLRRSIWVPGIVLYLVIVLPWFIAVQRKNPEFLRVFFLEHNIERFATDRFHHHQALWYYLPVLLIGLVPWTVMAVAATSDAIRGAVAEWRSRREANRYMWLPRTGDAFPEFLVLWALFPLIFFSFSGSKLPGYILPSIPPITILIGDYLNRSRSVPLPRWMVWSHSAFVGLVTIVILLIPQSIVHGGSLHDLGHSAWTLAILLGASTGALLLLVSYRFGAQWLGTATLIPICLLLFFLLRLNGPLFDDIYSARPLAQELVKIPDQDTPLAVLDTRRDVEYGLAFYRNQRVVNYRADGIPIAAHILVARAPQSDVAQLLGDRPAALVLHYSPQNLDIYWVAATHTP
jgi:4-amino-4-deoxy-L-arabinose transferase-like glycosyltransferase